MASVNKFLGIGNVTRDPELKFTPQGVPVLELTVAIDGFSGKEGEKRADFLPVVVWGKQAESCVKFLQKGSLVHLEGHLRQSRWEGEEGQKRSRVEIVASRVTFLAGTKKVERTGGPTPEPAPEGVAPETQVFGDGEDSGREEAA